jgi:hypothetical protein
MTNCAASQVAVSGVFRELGIVVDPVIETGAADGPVPDWPRVAAGVVDRGTDEGCGT